MSNLILSKLQWPSLAQDLAIMTVPGSPIDSLDIIYSTYHIDEETLQQILKVPYFQTLFQQALSVFRAQGGKAGHMFRAGSLSQSLSEKLYSDAMSNAMEAKDMIKFLELLMKSAGILGKDSEATVNTQVNVGVQLPLPQGLNNPKLKHALPV